MIISICDLICSNILKHIVLLCSCILFCCEQPVRCQKVIRLENPMLREEKFFLLYTGSCFSFTEVPTGECVSCVCLIVRQLWHCFNFMDCVLCGKNWGNISSPEAFCGKCCVSFYLPKRSHCRVLSHKKKTFRDHWDSGQMMFVLTFPRKMPVYQ